MQKRKSVTTRNSQIDSFCFLCRSCATSSFGRQSGCATSAAIAWRNLSVLSRGCKSKLQRIHLKTVGNFWDGCNFFDTWSDLVPFFLLEVCVSCSFVVFDFLGLFALLGFQGTVAFFGFYFFEQVVLYILFCTCLLFVPTSCLFLSPSLFSSASVFASSFWNLRLSLLLWCLSLKIRFCSALSYCRGDNRYLLQAFLSCGKPHILLAASCYLLPLPDKFSFSFDLVASQPPPSSSSQSLVRHLYNLQAFHAILVKICYVSLLLLRLLPYKLFFWSSNTCISSRVVDALLHHLIQTNQPEASQVKQRCTGGLLDTSVGWFCFSGDTLPKPPAVPCQTKSNQT